MAGPTKTDEAEAIRQAGSVPEGGETSTHPEGWPRIPAPDPDERRGPGAPERDRSDVTQEQKDLESDLPSYRAQERGGP